MCKGGNVMKSFVIAQVLSILGMIMNAASFQAKKQKSIITVQLFGSLFFAVNMFMLSAVTGGLLNTIGIFRALVYSHKEKFRHLKIWNIFFITLFVLSYFAAFFIAKKEVTLLNLIIEILPVTAMIATTISFSKSEASSVGKLGLISSPSWLVYDLINFSIGGIICEALSLISIVTAIIRLDLKKEK